MASRPPLKLFHSTKLAEFLSHIPAIYHVKVAEHSRDSWIEIDVDGRYGVVGFAIWKATDALYARDYTYPPAPGLGHPMEDDPIAIRAAINRLEMTPKQLSRLRRTS